MHRSATFEETVLRSLNELKNAQKKQEERQVLFEAKMIVKHDNLVNDLFQTQGRNPNLGQKKDLEPVRPEVHPVNPVPLVEDDFEDLDENFPVRRLRGVEKLEWNLRTNLDLKLRLKSRADEFITKKPKKTIRLIMKYLFLDSVLEHYCWNGTSEKQAFKKLTSINNFIFGVIAAHFKKYKRDQYQSYMADWLKHAKSRQRTVTYTYPQRRGETRNANDDDDDNDDDDQTDDNSDEQDW
ncbi:uncharacterized protein LOC119073068 [Bradysia coprophila]|uniref:uncharacterized protein LOC119073068 n=1 Tax=Bradysia coprophila TaxID=38358 RepID=UPI00187DA678|nr:uncharacterized protein LOC119073068 [Bradysia coprophila]